jgi:predicted aspartyl protease
MRPMRLAFAACAVALLAHAAGCASSPPPMRVTLPQGGIDVPVETWAGVPTVRVTVNGRGPYRFVVDTGATPPVGISTALARELGLPTSGGRTVLRAGNDQFVRLVRTRLKSLGLGDALFEDVPAVVGDVNVPGYAGLLGMRLFNGSVLTLKFPRRRLLVRPGRLDPGDADTFAARFVGDRPTVPLSPPVHGRPRTLHALIDTGSNGGVALPAALRQDLLVDPSFSATEKATTLGGEMSLQVLLLRGPMRLHRYDVQSPLVSLGPGGAVVGASILRDFDLSIDLSSRLVRLSPAGGVPPPADVAERRRDPAVRWHGVTGGAVRP